ncbi:MAG: hypothetical protein PUG48_04195 [Clostridia bacterium]|nr:hypothetical protein [Clostridia bacterium]
MIRKIERNSNGNYEYIIRTDNQCMFADLIDLIIMQTKCLMTQEERHIVREAIKSAYV